MQSQTPSIQSAKIHRISLTISAICDRQSGEKSRSAGPSDLHTDGQTAMEQAPDCPMDFNRGLSEMISGPSPQSFAQHPLTWRWWLGGSVGSLSHRLGSPGHAVRGQARAHAASLPWGYFRARRRWCCTVLMTSAHGRRTRRAVRQDNHILGHGPCEQSPRQRVSKRSR